jgi:hypothetical protein
LYIFAYFKYAWYYFFQHHTLVPIRIPVRVALKQMKNIILGLLITVSTILHSTAAVTVSSIDSSTWSKYHVNASNEAGGFAGNIRAGGNASGVNEYGVTSPASFNATVDLSGWWNWNVGYDFSISNENGVITMTLDGVTSPLFTATTPYAGLAFGAYANFPLAGISVINLSIDGTPLPDLSAVWGGNTFQGYEFSYGNWTTISGRVTLQNGMPGVLDPSSVDVHFGVIGVTSITPEPTRVLMLSLGFLSLFVRRRR